MSFFNMNFNPSQITALPNSATAAVAVANMAHLYGVAQPQVIQPPAQQQTLAANLTSAHQQAGTTAALSNPATAFSMPTFGFATSGVVAAPIMPFASYPSPYAAYGGTAAPMQGVPQPVLVPGSGASQSMGSTSTNTGASYGTVGYQPNNNQFNQKSSNGSKNSDSNSNVGSSDSKNSSVSRSGYSSTQQQSNLVPVQSFKAPAAIATITATASTNSSSSARSFNSLKSNCSSSSFSRNFNSNNPSSRYNRTGGGSSSSTNTNFNKTLTPGPSVYERSYSASASSSNTIPVASSRNNRAGDRNSSCNSADRNNSYVVGFQKRSNSNDFSNGGGGGNDKNTPYVPRGPLHYCDVCKISCAGPQTYKEHLEGQKHKKKDQQFKNGTQPAPTVVKPGQKTFYCELCDVTCTSVDTYNAHARGAKHLKCVKLYQKMNKPIPPAKEMIVNAAGQEPTVVTHKMSSTGDRIVGGSHSTDASSSGSKSEAVFANSSAASSKSSAGSSSASHVDSGSNSSETVSSTYVQDGILKIQLLRKRLNRQMAAVMLQVIPSFYANYQHVDCLCTLFKYRFSGKIVVKSGQLFDSVQRAVHFNHQNGGVDIMPSIAKEDECDPDPIGAEYIEETRDRDDKLVEFNCKLCDCKFNDPYAKDMHLKGRRHRFMYKRKVNPELEVDLKPGFRNKRLMEDRARTRKQREELQRRLAQDHAARMQMRRLEEELYIKTPGSSSTGFESWDDRHILTKHMSIYPSDQELEAVQNLVGRAEKILKLVSDKLALEDMKNPEIKKTVTSAKEKEAKKEVTKEESSSSDCATSIENKEATPLTTTSTELDKKEEIDSAFRQVKGVMRIGAVAKGLLLRGDKLLELAVLCQDRPTKNLLARLLKALSQYMSEITSDKYTYEVKVEDCAIIISSQDTYKMQLKASLTSTAVDDIAEDTEGKINPNLLSKKRCLALLAELRRAKWFQSRATNLPSAVIVMRILKDLMSRDSSWGALKQWPMEVLVEKAISSSSLPLSPGEAFRRVLECISSGVLLKGGLGLVDPCEAGTLDATRDLREQDREDVTASGQYALRCMAFKLIHKVLGVDIITPPTAAMIRKRRMEQMEASMHDDGSTDKSLAAKRERSSVTSSSGESSDAAFKPALENGTTKIELPSASKEFQTNGSAGAKTENISGAETKTSPNSSTPVRFSADIEAARKQAETSVLISDCEMQNEDMYDPGGEAAYEAMHYDDPYASYYGGGGPGHIGMGSTGGGCYGQRMMIPNFRPPFGFRPFRPWRGGGGFRGRGGFRPW